MTQAIFPTIDGQTKCASEPLNAARSPALSLYIHVPFCFHKCHYCDFYSFVDSRDRQSPFVDTLALELAAIAESERRVRGGSGNPPLRTIFIGGGTPSLLRVDLWRRLLAALNGSFDLSDIRAGRGEFTVECNPETVTPELMAALRSGGVGRVSVGAQSFEERHLKTLERWHDPANVQRSLRLAADAGIGRRSVDLIYAIPGQSIADLESDLDRALALDPGVEHISCYALTYEPNTAMTARLRKGEFAPAGEDLEAEMQELIAARLGAAGFPRYEVSNFATSDAARSLHNLAYWRCESWHAAGPSASGHLVAGAGGHRWKNVPRLTDWMDGVVASRGFAPIVDHEPPDPVRALAERIMMSLRVTEGLDGPAIVDAARTHAGDAAAARLERVAAGQSSLGLLELGPRWRLTDRGFLHADGVAAALMAALPRPGERPR